MLLFTHGVAGTVKDPPFKPSAWLQSGQADAVKSHLKSHVKDMIHPDLPKLRQEWQVQLPALSPDLSSVRPTLLPETSVFGRISC